MQVRGDTLSLLMVAENGVRQDKTATSDGHLYAHNY